MQGNFIKRVFNIIGILILLIPIFSNAQQSKDQEVLDSSAVLKPQVIPVIEIIKNIEEANEEIKSTERKSQLSNSIIEIDSLFPAYVKFIAAQKKKVKNFKRSSPNRQKINNLIRKWEGYQKYLSNWQSAVNDLGEKNIRLIEVASLKEHTWELTYKNAIIEKVPFEVSQNAKSVWNDFKKTKEEIIQKNNDLLKLEAKINKQKIIVNKSIEELVKLKGSEIYDLFYLRHEPLWKSSFNEKQQTKKEKDEVESVSRNISEIFKYTETSESNFYLFFIFIGFIIYMFYFVKNIFVKNAFNEQDRNLQNAKDIILNHSISGVIFLSLVIAKLTFSTAPMLFGDTLITLILVTALPLIKPYIDKGFKNVIYFVVVFFIIDSIKSYFWFNGSQYRFFLLFENVLVIASLLFFTFPYRKTRKMKAKGFGRLLIRLTPVVYFLSTVSIVSNILGYTNLADITLKIILQSSIITIIFYAVLMITGGICIGFIHNYFTKKESFDATKKLAIERKTLEVIRVITFLYWLFFFLKMIDIWAPLIQYLSDRLTEPYMIGNITFTIGAIINFILILASSFLITRFISFLFDEGSPLKMLKLPKGVPSAISLVIRYFIIGFGFVLALSSLGLDLGKFNLMAGALGLGIGFGLQSVISNFVSGLILVFERPILPGDTVEVNNLLGKVNRIGVRSSSIRTFDGAEVVVPNNNLIANDLINWTLSDSIKRIEILIGTTYGSDPNEILKILSDVAVENKFVLKDPSPIALFSEFGDSSLNFKLRFWVHYERGLETKSEISIAIYNKFNELGVEIPFPQQDVHIKDINEVQQDIKPKI